jgi:transposase
VGKTKAGRRDEARDRGQGRESSLCRMGYECSPARRGAGRAGGVLRSRAFKRPIGDQAYGGDPVDARLAERRIEMIAPHRSDRRRLRLRDGRKLRRYRRRRKVERLLAGLGDFRRPAVCSERRWGNGLGFV